MLAKSFQTRQTVVMDLTAFICLTEILNWRFPKVLTGVVVFRNDSILLSIQIFFWYTLKCQNIEWIFFGA